MSERSSTTLGYEWSTNQYLDRNLSRESFVASILDSVPPRPPYYARMKQLNSDGARPLGGLP
ncbi:MAG: MBL fold metallo-hydrolase, partial [Planctomycetota bacterium]